MSSSIDSYVDDECIIIGPQLGNEKGEAEED